MFGTLRYHFEGNGLDYSKSEARKRVPKLLSSSEQDSSCQRCYSKKLKCNRQKSGCDRCISSSTECLYVPSRLKINSRRKKLADEQGCASDEKNGKRVKSQSSSVPSQTSREAELERTSMLSPKVCIGTELTQDSGMNQPVVDYWNLWSSTMPCEQINTGFPTDITLEAIFNQPISPVSSLLHNELPALGFSTSAGSVSNIMSTDSKHSQASVNSSNESRILRQLASEDAIPSDRRTNSYLFDEKDPFLYYQHNLDILNASRSISCSDPSISKQDEAHPMSYCDSSCHCLQTVASVLETIDTKNSHVSDSSIDSMMAVHQDAIIECNKMLTCRICVERSERMMMLALVSENLVDLCEKAASKFKSTMRHSTVVVGRETARQRGETISGTTDSQRSFVLGEYEIKQPHELNCMIKILILLQLQALSVFLGRLKAIASVASREGQLVKLRAFELHGWDIARGLQQADDGLRIDRVSNIFNFK